MTLTAGMLDNLYWAAVAEGDYVANRNSARGFRTDTGAEITWNEHEFWRAENGRLADQWSIATRLDIG